jgi:hypothetical protein
VEAPEITFMVPLALARGGVPPWIHRPALGALALMAFLVLGELGGSGPTHHAARALLPAWLLGAVLIGEEGGRLIDRGRPRIIAFAPLALVVGSFVVRAPFPDDFARRSDALAIGSLARSLGAPALLVDTPDYAHLAVAAAFGRPSRVTPFDDRDPRRPRGSDPFESPATLHARTSAAPEAWLVVSGAHGDVARNLYTARAESGDLTLLQPRVPSQR